MIEKNIEPPVEIELLRKELTAKELKFCNAYLGEANFNGRRAAKIAGYQGNSESLGSQAWKMLRKDHIKNYIHAVYDEIAMPKNEILARLTTIARSSIDDVLNDQEMWFDKDKARDTGAIHQVKKFKIERMVKLSTETAGESFDLFEDEEPEITETTKIITEKVEFEMYDQMAALEKLGKFHKLFTDRIDANLDLNQSEVVFYLPENGRDKKD